MNTTVTEAVSTPGRLSLDKSPDSPLLEQTQLPVTMGNGTAGNAVDIHTNTPNLQQNKGEAADKEHDNAFGMRETKDYNHNKEKDSETKSPLMEDSSKTTEV